MPGSPIYGRKKRTEKRAVPRYALQVPVEISCAGAVRTGKVFDISSLGVRVEESGMQPPEGTVLGLKLALYANSVPLSFETRVVRHTETGGFGVEYLNLDPRVERILRTLLPKLAGAPINEEGAAVASGKFQLDIGKDLHEQIAEIAKEKGVETIDWMVGEIEKSATEAKQVKPTIRTRH